MKKTVRVIIEKEIEIDIPDTCLTPEFIAEFESGMFRLDEEDKREGLFRHAAYCVANDIYFAEGLGKVRSVWDQEREPETEMVVATTNYYETETEIVE